MKHVNHQLINLLLMNESVFIFFVYAQVTTFWRLCDWRKGCARDFFIYALTLSNREITSPFTCGWTTLICCERKCESITSITRYEERVLGRHQRSSITRVGSVIKSRSIFKITLISLRTSLAHSIHGKLPETPRCKYLLINIYSVSI